MNVYVENKTIRLARTTEGSDGQTEVTLTVRPVKRSADLKIQEAARLKDEDVASRNRHVALKIRYALVGCTGLACAFTKENVPGLGQIASEAVYDELNELELLCVMLLADGAPVERVEKVAKAALDNTGESVDAMAAGTVADETELHEKN